MPNAYFSTLSAFELSAKWGPFRLPLTATLQLCYLLWPSGLKLFTASLHFANSYSSRKPSPTHLLLMRNGLPSKEFPQHPVFLQPQIYPPLMFYCKFSRSHLVPYFPATCTVVNSWLISYLMSLSLIQIVLFLLTEPCSSDLNKDLRLQGFHTYLPAIVVLTPPITLDQWLVSLYFCNSTITFSPTQY